MDFKDHYSVLGLTPGCSETELKRSYRKLVRKFHPDAHGGSEESTRKFHEIQEAYDVLSNPEQRDDYDRRHRIIFGGDSQIYGPDARTQSAGSRARRSPSSSRTAPTESLNADRLSTLHRRLREELERATEKRTAPEAPKSKPAPTTKKHFFEKIKDSFPFGGRQASRPNEENASVSSAAKERERTYQFSVNALESLVDTTRELALQGGNTPRVIRVKVPAGIRDGAILKVHCPASGDHPAQTVEIKVRIEPHAFIERLSGSGILIKVPITPLEATIGVEIEVPTFAGQEKVPIPAAWNPEQLIRITGKGLPDTESGGRGDIYIKTYIVLPRNAGEPMRRAAEAMQSLYPEPVRKDLPHSLGNRPASS